MEVGVWEVVGGRKLRQLCLQWGVKTLSVSPTQVQLKRVDSLFTVTSERTSNGGRQWETEEKRGRALG